MMQINQTKCVKCGACIEHCTQDAIRWTKNDLGRDIVTITDDCVGCFCPAKDECPTDAIEEGECG